MAQFMLDPLQFDSSSQILTLLSPVAISRLKKSWQHLFRQAILALMPAPALADKFHPVMGRPTKELYSIAGLILIKEFKNLTNAQAAEAYMFDLSVHYALNLAPSEQSLCERTIERYNAIFREDELASQIMTQVTLKLVKLLELDVSVQRLDSTHVQSNMAQFGRMRLMGVAIKGFLKQLQKVAPNLYENLPEFLRLRYAPNRQHLFKEWKKDSDWTANRQTVAEDMHLLVEQFSKSKNVQSEPSYQMMVAVFHQQCEVKEGKIEVQEAPGANIIVNPSDPDATLDGHKGSGYQIQLCETSSELNATQLIVSAIPEQAHQSDSNAAAKVLEELSENELLPTEMIADTAYGSDANYCRMERNGVRLVAPVPGTESVQKTSGEIFRETDFPTEQREITDCHGRKHIQPFIVTCPAGVVPHRSHYHYKTETMEILNHPETCRDCKLLSRCPVRYASGWMTVTLHATPVRMSQRREYQKSEKFKTKYKRRSGIEATNSMLKRVTGLGRLRVRGKASVFMALLLKVAGWNILRAASNRKLMRALERFFGGLMLWIRTISRSLRSKNSKTVTSRQPVKFSC